MIQPLVCGRKEVGDELSGQQGTLAKLSVGLNFEKVYQEGFKPWFTSMPNVHTNDINLLQRKTV